MAAVIEYFLPAFLGALAALVLRDVANLAARGGAALTERLRDAANDAKWRAQR